MSIKKTFILFVNDIQCCHIIKFMLQALQMFGLFSTKHNVSSASQEEDKQTPTIVVQSHTIDTRIANILILIEI